MAEHDQDDELTIETGEDTSAEVDGQGDAEDQQAAQGDAAGDGSGDQGAQANAGDEDAGEVVVTLGDETPPSEDDKAAPQWVRELRQKNRQLVREKRELEQRLQASQPASKQPTLGPKPTLESCEYDEAKFEQALDEWKEADRKIKAAKAEQEDAQRKAQEAWDKRMQEYDSRKAALKVPDYEDAEATVFDVLSPVQRGIIIKGLEKPELMIAALGRAPERLKELAKMADPIDFAVAVAKLETKLKVNPIKSAPPPEKKLRSGTSVAGSVDSQLEALRAEATKTGDFSKVAEFRRQQRRAQQAA